MPTASPFCPGKPRVIRTESHPFDHPPFGLLFFGDPRLCPADYRVQANCTQHGSWLRWAGPEKNSILKHCPAGHRWKASLLPASEAWSLPRFTASSCFVYLILKIIFVPAFYLAHQRGKSVFMILIAQTTNSHSYCLPAHQCCWEHWAVLSL